MKNAIILLLTLILCTTTLGCSLSGNQKEEQPFEELRKNFKTKPTVTGPSPQEYIDEVPPENVSEVKYTSGSLELKAWISNVPDDGTKHPAVVFAHGGYAFGSEDWDTIKPYLDNGFIVMIPMLRGENGNPGSFECFYGEVDDVIAAGQYLASQPNVDTNKVFLSGHSVGGTLSMLTAMLPSPYKAIASFGASPDQKLFFQFHSDRAPFDLNDSVEISMRSPVDHVGSLKTPLYMYVGKSDIAYLIITQQMANRAKDLGKTCEFKMIDGDHFSSVEESITESIAVFNSY